MPSINEWMGRRFACIPMPPDLVPVFLPRNSRKRSKAEGLDVNICRTSPRSYDSAPEIFMQVDDSHDLLTVVGLDSPPLAKSSASLHRQLFPRYCITPASFYQQSGKVATMSFLKEMLDKKFEVVLFSSTAIALYGYDQGMMSLINTNVNYLNTMGIAEEDPLVGVIVSVYYLGCAIGAVLASLLADKAGRKPSIFACLAVTSLGNLLMFIVGLGFSRGAMTTMFIGRIVMGLGVGGIDSVIPVYSSELNSDGGRGEAMAKEFQSNIFGLNMAFAINLAVTNLLGKDNEWGLPCPF